MKTYRPWANEPDEYSLTTLPAQGRLYPVNGGWGGAERPAAGEVLTAGDGSRLAVVRTILHYCGTCSVILRAEDGRLFLSEGPDRRMRLVRSAAGEAWYAALAEGTD